MPKINLEAVHVTGEIRASPSKIEEILSDNFTFHYLPDCRITEKTADVFVVEDPNFDKMCKIEYPFAKLNSKADGRSFVVLTEYLMERKRQESFGICSISSSSVYKNNKAIIFIGGETNLGKTSCALELVRNGFRLYSDEKTLIDLEKATLSGGSRDVVWRKEILRKRFLENGEFSKLFYEGRTSPNIKAIILPHTDNGLKEPVIQQFDPLDLFWILTKEFCRRIRGNTKFINYYEYLLPSIDTEELAQKRIKLTREFAKKVPGYYFQGNFNQLNNFINRIYNN